MSFTITLAQLPAAPKLPKVLEKLQLAHESSDMIILPELWSSGFNRESMLASALKYREYYSYMRDLALACNSSVAGTLLCPSNDERYINRFLCFDNIGDQIAAYDKIHLFPSTNEHKLFRPGKAPCIFSYSNILFGMATCYDIRFPELFRFYATRGAAVVIVAACFPMPRLEHWLTLLKARAIENQIFIAATNAVGFEQVDEVHLEYFGNSMVISPDGSIMNRLSTCEEISSTVINLEDVIKEKMDINFCNDIKEYF